jgi:DNA-binding transcriptional ArsR family regulator
VIVVEDVLGALADSNRRTLLDHISQHGSATATMLAGELPISRQGVVQHLAVLAEVGLIEGRRQGRERRFRVRPETLNEAAKWMEELARQWDGRLATIKRLAEGEEEATRWPDG